MTMLYYAIAIYSCLNSDCKWSDPITTSATTPSACASMAPQIVASWWAKNHGRQVVQFRCGPSRVTV